MEDFNLPATTVPPNHTYRLVEVSDREVGQQKPFNRFINIVRWVFFPDQDGVKGDNRQLFLVWSPGRFEFDLSKPDRNRCLTGFSLLVFGDLHGQMTGNRLLFNFFPQFTGLIIN